MTQDKSEDIQLKAEVVQPKPKIKKKYSTQNRKIWTVNFSSSKNVGRAKVVIQALMTKSGMWSKGLTIMLAVEYCLQERVIKDFLAYTNTKRRGLAETRKRTLGNQRKRLKG